MVVPASVPRPPLSSLCVAAVALLTASFLVRIAPLRVTLAAARLAKRRARRPATRTEAARTLAARDWAARFFPGRAACLELSLAAHLACCLRGRAVDWCVGCRFDPCASHAWIEAEAGPVGEPVTPDRPFHVTLRI
jgi:hypothetical protein